jgi:hypothetical protein
MPKTSVKPKPHVTPADRRRFPRVSILQEILFDDRTLRKADDISEEGMFIATADTFLVGSVVDLKFRLFQDDRPIAVQAQVRHVTPGLGMGVRFLELPSAERSRIRKFVRTLQRLAVGTGRTVRRVSARRR